MTLAPGKTHAEAEAVNITLAGTSPALSDDPAYMRAERQTNLLRWDLTIAANTNGANAATINYAFKMEYDKNVALGNFKTGN